VITEADAEYGSRAFDKGRSELIAAALAVNSRRGAIRVSRWRIPTYSTAIIGRYQCRPPGDTGRAVRHYCASISDASLLHVFEDEVEALAALGVVPAAGLGAASIGPALLPAAA
jgi:hypothetical protein